ncbi:MAG TPA: RNA polymerase sigma factor [Pyrinomonadaceae bacterium]|jgi:RNA polymerase sigma factor (sigma-70 family)
MLQHLKIVAAAERHEELFLARYARLRGWALQLTEHDRERAEDLLHDAFIQFTFARPDLHGIGNLDGYLYTMLRNLHLSQVRRAQRVQHRSLAILDYDSAEIGLRGADPREQIRLQDELRQVCQYACLRKETSKAGSVLILRFLHGYYPREIAQLMKSTRQAVEERLRVARSEARQYLENPGSLRFICETPSERATAERLGFARTSDELLLELRQKIFSSCEGNCLTVKHLEQLYGEDGARAVGHATLAHIVSCPTCLDAVNRLLGLPLLCERFPTDTLGTDTGTKDGGGAGEGGGGGGGGAGGDGASEGELRRCRRRRSDVFEHRPAELCISVNGYLMATQRVSSELSEQTLSINAAEKIDFIEIFSEQEIRLLYVSIEDAPPRGAYKHSASIRLSDDRMLEASLSFSNPWPTLQVTYRDPLLKTESAAQPVAAEESVALPETAPLISSAPEAGGRERAPRASSFLKILVRLWRSFFNPSFWLRPATITAVVSVILIAALLVARLHFTAVSAAELLRRSAVAEQAMAADPSVVLHRTINLEERRSQGGDLISRRRIEVWQSAARGLKLRRIYDEQNHLIAGEWTRADGTSTLYGRERVAQARTSPDVAAGAILATGELWRLDVSAVSFNALVGPIDTLTVEEGPTTYVVGYASDGVGPTGRLLRRAKLTLRRADLRPVEQSLTVERDGEEREYRFIEAGFESRPTSAVSPELFEPEAELSGTTSAVSTGKDAEQKNADRETALSSSSVPAHLSEAVASPELEIEVTYLLNRIKADLGEQVSMTRTPGGALRVEALVETETRKEEILRALAPIVNNRAVRVEVSTVGEAVKRAAEQSQPGETQTREVEVVNNRIPAEAELRAYFSARLLGRQAIDEEIERYARRVMNRSRQALLRASALKRLVGRFSPEELRALDPQAQARWRSMIREHAGDYQREIAALRQELRPVFNSSGEASGEAAGDAALAQMAERLLQLSYATDEAVRSAFTISADGRTAHSIKTQQFWRSLDTARKLAAAIEDAYQ